MEENKAKERENFLIRMAGTIERVGNKIPHSMYLFCYLIAILIVASCICSLCGVSVTYQTVTDGQVVDKTVEVFNMLSKEGIVDFVTNLLTNYKNFALLSQNMMLIMFFSLAEDGGFFSAFMRKTMLGAPKKVIVYMLCVIGVCCNICGDAGMILSCTLGCIVYKAIGRNPWIGGITGYAACAAGYTANLMPASIDVNLSTITQSICDTMNLPYTVTVVSNYIFMIVATFVLAGVTTLISETIFVKMMGDRKSETSLEELDKARLTPDEERGLKVSGICFAIFVALLLLMTVPKNGWLRSADGKLVPSSPLMTGLVPLICLAFFILGVSFGIGSKQITKAKQVPEMMGKSVAKSAVVFVVFFFVAQFTYVFNKTNLATVISVGGEKLLRSIGLNGLPLLLIFIVIVAIINVFMYSASSKYLILAPIFVSMFANLGIDPAWTQLAYRIGDSCTNSITPLNACLVACITILNTYRDDRYTTEEAGLGTIIAPTFIVCGAMLVTFIVQFSVFYLCGIPIGIG